jgi:hypothetical protein
VADANPDGDAAAAPASPRRATSPEENKETEKDGGGAARCVDSLGTNGKELRP